MPSAPTSAPAAVLSIPQLALQEATGHSNVTVETLDGCTFLGKIRSVDIGTGNIHMETVTHRGADGDLSVMAKVVIKGSSVAMVRLPEVIRKAPFLEAMYSIAAATSTGAVGGGKKGSGGGGGGNGAHKKFGNGSGGSKLPTDALLRKSARDTRKAAANSSGAKRKPSSSTSTKKD